MSDGREGRCGYEFDPKAWEEEHDGPSAISSIDDTDILGDAGVWKCPHEVVNGHKRCVFHLDPDKRPESADAATEFVEVVEGHRGTPAQFIGGMFPEFDLTVETLTTDGTIDLRHARVGVLNWSDTVIEGVLDATRARFGDEFVRAGKESEVSFEATEFKAEVSFRRAEFGVKAGFSRTQFKEESHFDLAEFGSEAHFGLAEFGSEADFRLVEFRSEADFHGAEFRSEADFHGAGFRSEADFRGTKFGSKVGFWGAEFESETDFYRAKFGGVADFRGVEFVGEADFYGAGFGAEASFFGAEFERKVDFSGGEFRGDTEFQNAGFGGEAHFSRVGFRAEADFWGSTFETMAGFRQAEFGEETHFLLAKFRARADFGLAEFRAEANFYGAKFEAEADFGFTEFEAANFHEAVFETEADFQRAEFSEFATFGLTGMLPYGPFHGRIDFEDATFETPPQFHLTYKIENEQETHTAAFSEAVSFSGATFREGCNLPSLHAHEPPDFSGADLGEPDFRNADLSSANFEDADLSRAALYGADLSNARLYGALLSDARISDATDFGIRGREPRLPFVSPSPDVVYDPRSEPVYETDDGDVSNYTRAAAVYSEIASLADDNAASKLARTCYTWRKDMQRKRYWSSDGEGNEREYLSWFSSAVTNAVVRYGESPFRVVSLAGIVVLVFGLLYWGLDLLTATDSAGTPSLVDSLYFSTLTFTTLGLGDFRPVNDLGRALAIVETSAGVVLLALLVFVFSRRATR